MNGQIKRSCILDYVIGKQKKELLVSNTSNMWKKNEKTDSYNCFVPNIFSIEKTDDFPQRQCFFRYKLNLLKSPYPFYCIDRLSSK